MKQNEWNEVHKTKSKFFCWCSINRKINVLILYFKLCTFSSTEYTICDEYWWIEMYSMHVKHTEYISAIPN